MWTKRMGGWLVLGSAFAAACSSGEGQEVDTAEQALTRSTPYRVKALDYSNFKDNDSIHEGNCGSGAVDAETTSDPSGGGCNVGWTKAGEWLEYTLQTATATKVNFVARVASANSGKTFRLLLDNVDISGSLTVPNSGWQAFADRVVKDVSLSAGTHTLRVSFETGDTNLNYIDVTPAAVALPARIEAEDYQRSYESTPTQKSGNGCDRGDGVDKELTGDSAGGNCNIGWTTAGEWLEYDVSVSQAGAYTIKARAGTGVDGRTLRLSVDGTDVATLAVPKTSWTVFQDIAFENVNLSAGAHTVRVTFPQGDTNLNYLDFVAPPAPPTATASSTGESLGAAAAYNAFVFQDLSVTPSIAGPVAAGRDISASSFGYNTSSAGEIGVVAGRNFAGSNGSVRQDLVYGNTASLTNVGVLDGVSKQGTPVDFVAEKANLDALEANLVALPTNGTTTVQPYATIDFVGTHPALNVFTVEGSKLGSTDALNFSVPATSTVVVNVSGSSAVFETTGMQLNGLSPGHLLWNFRDASSIRIALTGFKGTLLATNAAVTQSSSQLEGALIASSLTGGDNGLLWKPFDGQFPWTPADPSGATAGSLTIRGQIKDADGNRVVGARVDLQGAAQAVRYTDFSGSYVFHVNPGSYSVWASGACSISPASANLGSVSANVVRDFSSSGSNCVTATPALQTATGHVLDLKRGTVNLGRTRVNVATQSSASAAQARLDAIANEQTGSTSLTVLGSPAIERNMLLGGTKVLLPAALAAHRWKTRALTTSIAAGSDVVRFESRLPESADAGIIARFVSAGRNFDAATSSLLHGSAPAARATQTHAGNTPTPPASLAISGFAGTQNGELQVAASDTSNAMVVARIDTPVYSTDGGENWLYAKWNTTPPPPAASFKGVGDPSITTGAPDSNGKQAMYLTMLAQVAKGTTTTGPTSAPTVAIGLFKSTDDGQTFDPAAKAFPFNCASDTPACLVPDQTLVVADRHNRAKDGTGADFDQLYLTWRHYDSTGAISIMAACSADGGSTWNYNLNALASTGGDYPRPTVGIDGSFYVTYAVFKGNDEYDLQVQKFSSCASGFQPAATPSTVDTVQNPAKLAGMPRQPTANYSLAVSEGDPTGNTVFAVYSASNADNTASDVTLATSRDGGVTWPTNAIINTSSAGHRYFPSICSTGTKSYVTWYDRRAGGDKTAYYRSTILDNGNRLGSEFNLTGSGFEDPQCLTGFPGGGATTTEAETNCTNLPNVLFGVGECTSTCAAGATAPCGSLQKCDFRAGAPGGCAAGETCTLKDSVVSPGAAKYGDYAIQACAQGRLYAAWATGTTPKDACNINGQACTVDDDCCGGNTCVGNLCSGGAACTATGGACTAHADCCSESCQGGQCFAPVVLYTFSGGETDVIQPPKLQVEISASVGQVYGPTVCGSGKGFTPGGQVGIIYRDVPGVPPAADGTIATTKKILGSADGLGNIEFTDTSQVSQGVACDDADRALDPYVILTDEATGNTVENQFGLWSCMWCTNVVQCLTETNGGC